MSFQHKKTHCPQTIYTMQYSRNKSYTKLCSSATNNCKDKLIQPEDVTTPIPKRDQSFCKQSHIGYHAPSMASGGSHGSALSKITRGNSTQQKCSTWHHTIKVRGRCGSAEGPRIWQQFANMCSIKLTRHLNRTNTPRQDLLLSFKFRLKLFENIKLSSGIIW